MRDRVEEAIATSENTLRARIDKFGVTQPNIQRLASSGRILIELPGVTDKRRVEKLLQGTANLEFWETYDNKEIYPLLEKANTRLKEILNPALDSTKKDSSAVAADTMKAKADSLASTKDTAKTKTDANSLTAQLGSTKDSAASKPGASRADTIAKMKKENPLFAVLGAAIGRDAKGQTVLGNGPVVGYAAVADTGKVK